MWERDILVAVVACSLGALLVFGGVANSDRCFSLPTPNYLTLKFGRSAARFLMAGIGVVLIALGCRIGWMASQHGPVRLLVPSANEPTQPSEDYAAGTAW